MRFNISRAVRCENVRLDDGTEAEILLICGRSALSLMVRTGAVLFAAMPVVLVIGYFR
ncbi:MAG TPA: hypothetical protein VNF47_15400 [Streptosporangiaceae bacterium]|nr:hypothetical protein [Streptosporangiaceae bacterium]